MADQPAPHRPDVYRDGEPTTLCAVCERGGQRREADRRCPACETPLCADHVTEEGLCRGCATVSANRRDVWGVASRRRGLALWVGGLLFGAALLWVMTHPDWVEALLNRYDPKWILLATLGPIALLLVGLRYQRGWSRRGSSADQRLFARERRESIEKRRSSGR